MTQTRLYQFWQRKDNHFTNFRERLWRESQVSPDMALVYPFRFGSDELVVMAGCPEQGPRIMQPQGDLIFRVNSVNIVVGKKYDELLRFIGETGKEITRAKNKVVKVTNYKLKR